VYVTSQCKCTAALGYCLTGQYLLCKSYSRLGRPGDHKPGKPGILWDFSERGKLREGILREFCATSGKNCNKQSIFSSSFKYLCKTAVDWVNRIIRVSGSSDPALDEGHYYIYQVLFVAITHGKVSLWLWKSLENSEFFSPTLWPPWPGHTKVNFWELLE